MIEVLQFAVTLLAAVWGAARAWYWLRRLAA